MQAMPIMKSGKIWMLLPTMYIMNAAMASPENGERAVSHSFRVRTRSISGSCAVALLLVLLLLLLRASVAPLPNEPTSA